MSWIKDVKSELKALDLNKKKLRSFGFLVGSIFILISSWIIYSKYIPLLSSFSFGHLLLIIGVILFVMGLILPSVLKPAYKFWMGFAFALGWLVSRIILIILFYIVVTPISFLARIFRKEFLDQKFRDGKTSYWVIKDKAMKKSYLKMY